MKVIAIKIPRGGNLGVEVTYLKRELKSQVSWENETKKKYKWPAQGQFLNNMKGLGRLVTQILELDPEWSEELSGISFQVKPAGFVLKAERVYNPYDPKYYAVSFETFCVAPEHELYNEIETAIEQLIADFKEYASTQHEVNTRQMVMDLYGEGKFKLPKELEGINIEEVSDPELLQRFAKSLEKRGAIVLMDDLVFEDSQDSKEEESSEDEEVVTEEEVMSEQENFDSSKVTEQPEKSKKSKNLKVA